MAHKFVPRKGFKKDKDASPAPEHEPAEAAGADTPPPEPAAEEVAPPPPLEPEPEPASSDDPPASKPKFKGRSAKDSILNKLPGKAKLKAAGPASKPAFLKKRPDRPPPRARSGVPLLGLALVSVAVFLLVGGGLAIFLLTQVPGYQGSLPVTAPTRLDWTFVEGRQSLEKPDPVMTVYDSAKNRFELYVPPDADASQPLPMILFLSADPRPAGWSGWKQVCIDKRVIFASPANAGDDMPLWHRTRVALDVLDTVRRKHNVDPDRTYIAGMFGGARAAVRIAVALPELFGGVIAVSGGSLMRDEAWLRYRARERLSFAWVYGEKDPGRNEVEKLLHPLFDQLKIRSRMWEVAGQSGRAMPPTATFAEIFDWLQEGPKDRPATVDRFPTSHLAGAAAAPSREEWSKLYLDEAKERLRARETYTSGVAQLALAHERWLGLPAAREAERLYQQEQADHPERFQDDFREQREFDIVLAKLLTAYLSKHDAIDYAEIGRLGWMQERQDEWQKLVKQLWRRIGDLGSDDEKKEAAKNLAAIAKGSLQQPTPTTAPKK